MDTNASDRQWVNGYEAIDRAVDVVEGAWGRLLSLGERAWRVFGMETKLQLAKQYAFDHPILTLCALITTCMCSIPIMCFMFFAMGTLFFTFLGFLFVEGFLLTFASIILGGALFFVGLLSVGASSFLALAWCLISASTGLVHRIRSKFMGSDHRPLNFSRIYTNGDCVKETVMEKED